MVQAVSIYNTEESEIERNDGCGVTTNIKRPSNTGGLSDDPEEMKKARRFGKNSDV